MSDDSLTRRFRGSVQLVTWHLWRVAESTDLEKAFADAKTRGMINDEQEQFIRKCIDINDRLDSEPGLADQITMDIIKEMQMMAIRLNTADSA